MNSRKTTSETKRIRIDSAQIKTYVYLYNIAQLSIEEAKNEDDNEVIFYKCMTAVVFLAFCIEAYLNHLGVDKIENWDEDFERLSPLAKLRLLMNSYGKIDLGIRPFQSFLEIFKIRNQLAHAKTVWVAEKYPKEPMAKWQRSCTVPNVEKLYADTEEMIRIISVKINGNPDVNPFQNGLRFSGFVLE